MQPGKLYKHKNARDVVFYCVAIKTDNTAVGHYMNCHYYEIGARPDLFLCTDDLFVIQLNDQDWRPYEGTFDF
jgi:hypothetical protein